MSEKNTPTSGVDGKGPRRSYKLRKRLISLSDLGSEGFRLVFEDGEEVVADLVVGGDGIRSVCFLSH
jgi:salicylate hydroxylase